MTKMRKLLLRYDVLGNCTGHIRWQQFEEEFEKLAHRSIERFKAEGFECPPIRTEITSVFRWTLPSGLAYELYCVNHSTRNYLVVAVLFQES